MWPVLLGIAFVCLLTPTCGDWRDMTIMSIYDLGVAHFLCRWLQCMLIQLCLSSATSILFLWFVHSVFPYHCEHCHVHCVGWNLCIKHYANFVHSNKHVLYETTLVTFSIILLLHVYSECQGSYNTYLQFHSSIPMVSNRITKLLFSTWFTVSPWNKIKKSHYLESFLCVLNHR